MADVLSLRAEIKAWERSFKTENGTPPTVDDIKKNPLIAEKYKQYKKLSKAVASTSSNSTQQNASTPSTPPRTTRAKQPSSALLSRTRVVQSTAPLASFNPFSPQKKQKGKEREMDSLATLREARHVPTTSKLPGGSRQRQSFSPEPNSSTVQSTFSSTIPLSLQLRPHAEAANAVSRARKRLRGEPVSPSPNKDKRRRVLSQTTLPFPRFDLGAQSSDEEEPHEGDSSFVDNSPVKSASTGKLFPALFEETLVPMDLFGVKSNLGLSNYNSGSQLHKGSVEHPKTSKRVPSSRGLPGLTRDSAESHLTLGKTDLNHNLKMDAKTGQDKQAGYDTSRASFKRSLSEDEDDTTHRLKSSRAKSPLLPPSPPPSTNATSYNEAGKTKARVRNMMNKSRKKAKKDEAMSHGPESDDEEESSTKLRIVGRNSTRQHHATNEDDEGISDVDAVLGYTRFTGPRGMSPAETRQEEGEGTLDVDLPDKLRNVLALETTALKAQASREDSLIQGVLYGRRVTHYNPQKGGEIWDVGEDPHDDAETGRYTEGEEDWEGEPVPWEAAEL